MNYVAIDTPPRDKPARWHFLDDDDDADVCLHGHLRQADGANLPDDAGRLGKVLLSGSHSADCAGPKAVHVGENREFKVSTIAIDVSFGGDALLLYRSQHRTIG